MLVASGEMRCSIVEIDLIGGFPDQMLRVSSFVEVICEEFRVVIECVLVGGGS